MASIQKLNLLDLTASAAASTNGAVVSLPAKAKNLIGNLTVANPHAATVVTAKIQHSANGSTGWTDYITFTATGAGVSVVEVKLPATDPVLINVRATVALSGATLLADVIIDLYFENFSGS